jgi:DNA-binding CsgD family transcriptional regulator
MFRKYERAARVLDIRASLVRGALAGQRNLRLPTTAVSFVSDPEHNVELPANFLERCYGLTAAETRLTMILLEGHSLKEAADLCGVTQNTAKTQLKSVFSKTHVQRQSELVRILLAGACQLRDSSSVLS